MAKEDLQHRVRLLLQEALPMLCRSGLAQTSEFSVEALIGITLNKDDVFLVSIKETVKSDGSVLSKSANHESKANEPERNQRKKTPRKRKHSKSVKSSYSEESENASDLDTDHPDSAKRDRLDMSQDDESCPNPDYPSSETHRGDSENEDDSQEAVIVKEEPGVAFNTSGGGSTADQSFATNSFSRFGASSVHLEPPRVDATSPARLSQSLPLPGTSFSHSPNSQQAAALLETQAALAQGSMNPDLIEYMLEHIDDYYTRISNNQWLCFFCASISSRRNDVKKHIRAIHFNQTFTCACGRSFRWVCGYHKHRKQCAAAIAKDMADNAAANTANAATPGEGGDSGDGEKNAAESNTAKAAGESESTAVAATETTSVVTEKKEKKVSPKYRGVNSVGHVLYPILQGLTGLGFGLSNSCANNTLGPVVYPTPTATTGSELGQDTGGDNSVGPVVYPTPVTTECIQNCTSREDGYGNLAKGTQNADEYLAATNTASIFPLPEEFPFPGLTQ